MTRPTYTGGGLWPVALILAASALYACAADASEPDPSRPWEICIPVTTEQAAAYAATHPPRFQGGAYRSTFFAGDPREPGHWGRGGAGTPTGGRETPVSPPPDAPPIPIPAAWLLLASAMGALALIRRIAR